MSSDRGGRGITCELQRLSSQKNVISVIMSGNIKAFSLNGRYEKYKIGKLEQKRQLEEPRIVVMNYTIQILLLFEPIV